MSTLFAESQCCQALDIAASSPMRFVIFPSYSFWICCDSFLCSRASDSARLSNGEEMPETVVAGLVRVSRTQEIYPPLLWYLKPSHELRKITRDR